MGQSADFLACIKALAPKGGNSTTTVIFIACISHLKMHILLNVFDEAVKMDFVKSPLLKVLTLEYTCWTFCVAKWKVHLKCRKPEYSGWRKSISELFGFQDELTSCFWGTSFLLERAMYVLVAQSCPTLCDSMDCSPPGSSVHGILQAEILEWIAVPFSRGSSWPRDWTHVSCVSCIGGRFFIIWANREAPCTDRLLRLEYLADIFSNKQWICYCSGQCLLLLIKFEFPSKTQKVLENMHLLSLVTSEYLQIILDEISSNI